MDDLPTQNKRALRGGKTIVFFFIGHSQEKVGKRQEFSGMG